ncbi:MAG: GHMP kinase [Gammaproteobacteria bacterium]|nr:GHMP kinase [Gammaproteobacteria bacterium]
MTQRRHHQSGCGRVLVDTQARLHLGFLDMSGTLGRRFGSLGLSIAGFHTELCAHRAADFSAQGAGAERALRYAREIAGQLGLRGGLRLELRSAIPDHLGLGSGTQMALAVGRAVAALCDRAMSTRDVAACLRRGGRSGIGIGAFDQGGFLVDSGVGEDGAVPPVTARLAFPDEWRVLLVMDARGQGLHGARELDAFRRLPPFPREVSAHLCHLTLMQILPGVQERRLQPVADGIAELQRRVGDHFAPAQGGRFTSTAVADALAWIDSLGFTGIGQSSWGPTGFALLPSEADAQSVLRMTRQRFGDLSSLRFVVTRAHNQGSRIELQPQFDALKEMH